MVNNIFLFMLLLICVAHLDKPKWSMMIHCSLTTINWNIRQQNVFLISGKCVICGAILMSQFYYQWFKWINCKSFHTVYHHSCLIIEGAITQKVIYNYFFGVWCWWCFSVFCVLYCLWNGNQFLGACNRNSRTDNVAVVYQTNNFKYLFPVFIPWLLAPRS